MSSLSHMLLGAAVVLAAMLCSIIALIALLRWAVS